MADVDAGPGLNVKMQAFFATSASISLPLTITDLDDLIGK